MANQPHPLLAAFRDVRRVELPEDEVAEPVAARAIDVPWTRGAGLHLGDLFVAGGGHIPLPVPPASAAMPPLRLTLADDVPLFLAQSWSDADIASFEHAGRVGVDCGVLCVMPSSLARDVPELLEMSELPRDDGPYTVARVAGEPFVAVHTGDFSADLFHARDRSGNVIGWVLNLAWVDVPWQLPDTAVPRGMRCFVEPQIRYAIAGRTAPTVRFGDIARAIGIPSRLLGGTGLGMLRLLEIEPGEYHFFAAELARIGLPSPQFLCRLQLEHQHHAVPEQDWRAMLAVTARLARNTRGILYQIEGKHILDFA